VDPYHDGRSGYFFAVNAAGTLRDGVLYNDDWNDDSWDGIWEGRAHVDGEGWTVEMRIPYSQLRFRREDSNAWGVNFRRYVCRTKEEDYVAYTPKKASGFVSRFPKLSGLQGIVPPRRIAVTPYTTTKAEFTGHGAGPAFALLPCRRCMSSWRRRGEFHMVDFLTFAGVDPKSRGQ